MATSPRGAIPSSATRHRSARAQPHGRQEVIGADYFKAMQIPLLAGRLFTDADDPDGQRVVIDRPVSRRPLLQGQDPIGQQIRPWRTDQPDRSPSSVSSARSTRSISGSRFAKERLYYPMRQTPLAMMDVVLKAGRDPRALVTELRALVASIDPEQPLADVKTMDEWVGQSLEGRRTPTVTPGALRDGRLDSRGDGHLRVLAYGVAQRERELGIRQALGADRPDILALVLKEGLRTAGLGLPDRPDRLGGVDALPEWSSLRGERTRPDRLPRGHGGAAGGRRGRVLLPGAPRDRRGSGSRVASVGSDVGRVFRPASALPGLKTRPTSVAGASESVAEKFLRAFSTASPCSAFQFRQFTPDFVQPGIRCHCEQPACVNEAACDEARVCAQLLQQLPVVEPVGPFDGGVT